MFRFFNQASRALLCINSEKGMNKIPLDVIGKSIAVTPSYGDVDGARSVLRRTMTFVGDAPPPVFFSHRDKKIHQNNFDLAHKTNQDLIPVERILSYV